MSIKPTFQGEVLLRRWSNSSTQGVQVTFALSDESDLEPLTAKTGKRFMAVLVEIADDETPAEPAKKEECGPLCKEAISLCGSAAFQEWAGVKNAYGAGNWLKGAIGIETRKELDIDPAAAEEYRNLVRQFRREVSEWRTA